MTCKCCGREFTPGAFAYKQKYCDFCKRLYPQQRLRGLFYTHHEKLDSTNDVNLLAAWQKWKMTYKE